MDVWTRVAWNLRRLRVDRGLSQEALATDAGVDRSYVGRLERADENPTIGVLDKLATAVDADIAELFAPVAAGQKAPKPLPSGRKRPNRRQTKT